MVQPTRVRTTWAAPQPVALKHSRKHTTPPPCPETPPGRWSARPQGHRLKNMNCKLIRELRTLHTENKLLLTGTPLQVGAPRLRCP